MSVDCLQIEHANSEYKKHSAVKTQSREISYSEFLHNCEYFFMTQSMFYYESVTGDSEFRI